MTVIDTIKDPEALTFSVIAEFSAPPSRVWQIWSDPRQLERWWGPPTWPATFEEHDFVVGGNASYYMTGPEGEKARGWWTFKAINEPASLAFDDGFSDESGTPNLDMPTIGSQVELAEVAGGTRMTVKSTFASAEQMQQVIEMGMVEGMNQAMSQIDAILAGS